MMNYYYKLYTTDGIKYIKTTEEIKNLAETHSRFNYTTYLIVHLSAIVYYYEAVANKINNFIFDNITWEV